MPRHYKYVPMWGYQRMGPAGGTPAGGNGFPPGYTYYFINHNGYGYGGDTTTLASDGTSYTFNTTYLASDGTSYTAG